MGDGTQTIIKPSTCHYESQNARRKNALSSKYHKSRRTSESNLQGSGSIESDFEGKKNDYLISRCSVESSNFIPILIERHVELGLTVL